MNGVSIRSIYNKIFKILDFAQKNGDCSIAEFSDRIHKSNFEEFTYVARKGNRIITDKVNEDTIKTTIRFCMNLKLLNKDNCILTEIGRKAVVRDKYEPVLSNQIMEYLQEKGVSFTDIINIIKEKFLQSKDKNLPEPRKIFQEIADRTGMGFDTFKVCMHLLSICGDIEAYKRKIYLPRG